MVAGAEHTIPLAWSEAVVLAVAIFMLGSFVVLAMFDRIERWRDDRRARREWRAVVGVHPSSYRDPRVVTRRAR